MIGNLQMHYWFTSMIYGYGAKNAHTGHLLVPSLQAYICDCIVRSTVLIQSHDGLSNNSWLLTWTLQQPWILLTRRMFKNHFFNMAWQLTKRRELKKKKVFLWLFNLWRAHCRAQEAWEAPRKKHCLVRWVFSESEWMFSKCSITCLTI